MTISENVGRKPQESTQVRVGQVPAIIEPGIQAITRGDSILRDLTTTEGEAGLFPGVIDLEVRELFIANREQFQIDGVISLKEAKYRFGIVFPNASKTAIRSFFLQSYYNKGKVLSMTVTENGKKGLSSDLFEVTAGVFYEHAQPAEPGKKRFLAESAQEARSNIWDETSPARDLLKVGENPPKRKSDSGRRSYSVEKRVVGSDASLLDVEPIITTTSARTVFEAKERLVSRTEKFVSPVRRDDSPLANSSIEELEFLQDPEKKNISQVEDGPTAAPRDDRDVKVAADKTKKKSRSSRHPDWITITTNDADTEERLNDADSSEDDAKSSRHAILHEALIERSKKRGEVTMVWKEPPVYPELTADEQERISLIEQERREQKTGIPILPEDLADKLYGSWERLDIDSAIKVLLLTRPKHMSPLLPPNMHEFTQQAVRFLAWKDAGKPAETFEFYPKNVKSWDIHKALVSVAYQMIEQELADTDGNGPSLGTMMRQVDAVVTEANMS